MEARNPQSAQNVDWSWEIYNGRELQICPPNLKYNESILGGLKEQSTQCDEQRTVQMIKPFVELKNG